MRTRSSLIRRARMAGAVATVVAGAAAFCVVAAPGGAFAEPDPFPLPTPVLDFGDGTLLDHGATLEVPVTATCEAFYPGEETGVELRVTQRVGDEVASAIGTASLPCTGEAETTTIDLPVRNDTLFVAGPASGELDGITPDATVTKPLQITE